MTDSTASYAMGNVAAPEFFAKEEPHHENGTLLGFWIYLMSDCLIFAVLFSCNAVFIKNTAGGPTPAQALDLTGVAINTAMLLLSSIAYGFGMLEMARKRQGAMLFWLVVAGLFAVAFVGLEIHEFIDMIVAGYGPGRSAFLSSFFTLVGTHGLHVTFGIIWLSTMIVQVLKHGLTTDNQRRLTCLSMFWHFLDLIWVGVFSFVYLTGVLR